MQLRDTFAILTLLSSFVTVVWLGLDAWILAVWAIVAVVLTVLAILGRLLAKELGIRAQAPHRLPWIAGAVGAFISCTMAASIVRVQAPVATFWALGGLMVLAVVSLRLAYAPTQPLAHNATRPQR